MEIPVQFLQFHCVGSRRNNSDLYIVIERGQMSGDLEVRLDSHVPRMDQLHHVSAQVQF